MTEMLARLSLFGLFTIIAVEIPEVSTTVINFSAASPEVQGIAQLSFLGLAFWSLLGGIA